MNLLDKVIAGRFKILRRKTCGSYSEIYLAANLTPKPNEPETVVIKVLNLDLRGQLEPELERILVENFQFEGQSLGRLAQHPNIVRLFEAAQTIDQTGRQIYYLALEHIEGDDLQHFCRAKPLTLEYATLLIGQLCSALSYSHEHGIIHRDVKPNNCLVSEDARVKLLDFGTGRLLNAQNGVITRVGTDVYSAPESYSPGDNAQITAAADVYSLAKLLLFMLTGETPAHLAQKQIKSLPRRIAAEPFADALSLMLSKATRNEPTERYQSADEFHAALRQVLELTEVSPATCDNSRPREYYSPPKHTRLEIPVDCGRAGAAALPLQAFAVGGFGDGLPGHLRGALSTAPNQLAAQLVVVALLAAVLLTGIPPLLSLRHKNPPAVSRNAPVSVRGKEVKTITDVNIRSGPGAALPKVGLAEKDSRLRILSCNNDGTWCEIQVTEHGREKADPNTSDQGWVNRKYLIFD